MQTKIDLEAAGENTLSELLEDMDKDTLEGMLEKILKLGALAFLRPEMQAAYREWHIRKYGCPPEETFDHV